MARRKRSRKWIYWVVVILLAAMAVMVGYKVWEGYFKDDRTQVEEETVVEVAQKVEEKESEEAKSEVETVAEVEEVPVTRPQYEGVDPNTSGEITGVVTYAGVNADVLMIRVNIDQYLAGGNCVLMVAQDGAELYSEKVRVADSAATATCEGFNVPTAQIAASGRVGIRIMVTSGDKTGIIEGEVNL